MLGCIYYTQQGGASFHIVALRSIGFYVILACDSIGAVLESD